MSATAHRSRSFGETRIVEASTPIEHDRRFPDPPGLRSPPSGPATSGPAPLRPRPSGPAPGEGAEKDGEWRRRGAPSERRPTRARLARRDAAFLSSPTALLENPIRGMLVFLDLEAAEPRKWTVAACASAKRRRTLPRDSRCELSTRACGSWREPGLPSRRPRRFTAIVRQGRRLGEEGTLSDADLPSATPYAADSQTTPNWTRRSHVPSGNTTLRSPSANRFLAL
jgi:hypothetical protein